MHVLNCASPSSKWPGSTQLSGITLDEWTECLDGPEKVAVTLAEAIAVHNYPVLTPQRERVWRLHFTGDAVNWDTYQNPTAGATELIDKAANLQVFTGFEVWIAPSGEALVIGTLHSGTRLEIARWGEQITEFEVISEQLRIKDEAAGHHLAFVTRQRRRMAVVGTALLAGAAAGSIVFGFGETGTIGLQVLTMVTIGILALVASVVKFRWLPVAVAVVLGLGVAGYLQFIQIRHFDTLICGIGNDYESIETSNGRFGIASSAWYYGQFLPEEHARRAVLDHLVRGQEAHRISVRNGTIVRISTSAAQIGNCGGSNIYRKED